MDVLKKNFLVFFFLFVLDVMHSFVSIFATRNVRLGSRIQLQTELQKILQVCGWHKAEPLTIVGRNLNIFCSEQKFVWTQEQPVWGRKADLQGADLRELISREGGLMFPPPIACFFTSLSNLLLHYLSHDTPYHLFSWLTGWVPSWISPRSKVTTLKYSEISQSFLDRTGRKHLRISFFHHFQGPLGKTTPPSPTPLSLTLSVC